MGASAMPLVGAGIGAAGSILGNKNNETTQVADPWSGQQPYLKDVFQQASNQYRSEGPQYYPGQTVAPFNADQLQGQQYGRDYARTSQPMIDQYQGALQFAQGKVLDIANNPYVQDMADAATNPIQKRLMEQILPAVRGSATLAGNQHSSMRGIREGQAIGDTTEAMANARANIFGNAYGQGLNTFSNAFSAGPTALAMGQTPGQSMSQIGSQGQAMDQARMLDAQQRWDFMQNQPENRLAEYSKMIQGQYGGTKTTTPPPSSPIAGAIGGGMLGYGMQQQGWNPFGGGGYVGPNMRGPYTDNLGFGAG